MMTAPTPLFAKARARQVLLQAGLPVDDDVTSASSTRNEVLISGDYVVRVNREPNQRLKREAEWCRSLPLADWAPKIIASGADSGVDYVIVARKPGQPLSRCWPMMNQEMRRRAVSEIADVLRTIHRTPTPLTVPPLLTSTHLLDPACLNPAMPMILAIERLADEEFVDRGLMAEALEMVLDIGEVLSDYPVGFMIHGDLTFENILWHRDRISAVLDFEWARGAPPGIDLDVILRYCSNPAIHVPEEYASQQHHSDYDDVLPWLVEDLPELVERPRLGDRLTLYSLAFDVNELVAEPPERNRRELGPMHPMNRIASLLKDGGFSRRAFARAGVPMS